MLQKLMTREVLLTKWCGFKEILFDTMRYLVGAIFTLGCGEQRLPYAS